MSDERSGRIETKSDGYMYVILEKNDQVIHEVKAQGRINALQRIEYWCATGFIEDNW
jgi:hypothetical protein